MTMDALDDLDRIWDRHGTGSLKWDGARARFGAEVLPMWVADMDLPTAPVVLEALRRRLEHPILGYPWLDHEYLTAASQWMRQRHGWGPETGQTLVASGVVPALFAAVRALSAIEDTVLVLTPVYPPFLQAVRSNGRRLRTLPLEPDAEGVYRIPWEQLADALSGARLLLFCSPHNPVGRVWSAEELSSLVELCRSRGVRVVSDEIHADLSQLPHTPLPRLMPEAVLLSAPGKAFNMAGLGGAFLSCGDEEARRLLREELERSQCQHATLPALVGGIAAWREGGPWLEGIRSYLRGHALYLAARLAADLPALGFRPPEFGYLAWLDLRRYGQDDERIDAVLREVGLGLNAGADFGPGGAGFRRLNFGCPRPLLQAGLDRLQRALDLLSPPA
ncbi:MAG: PatB family C-S lyase [Acidithiobacillus sp.]|uniref:PatB family C-S lyase n=1 Tax=Acidithiobacillus sp. TaxID=1872118 RepID=UPI003CFC50F6